MAGVESELEIDMAMAVSSTPISETASLDSAAALLLSPTRLSRLQEKEELQQLNDRLATYIERARALEAYNSVLKQRIAEQEDSTDRELSTIRLGYEAELADVRQALDNIAMERATLQVELGKLGEEHRQLHSRNSKTDADLNLARARVRDLDAQLITKETDLAMALSENRGLENRLRELKDQVATLERSLQDAKKNLHSEMLTRVDLENHMKTLQEQMTFEKHLHEEEIKEAKRIHEIRIAEIECGRQSEFQSKLADALKGLREQHEEHIQEYKEELERTFDAKIGNIQRSAAINSQLADVAREELIEAKMRIDGLRSAVQHYESKIAALENRARELQEMLDYERDLNRRRLAEKEREIMEVQQQAQIQLEEYGNLLDVKLALDLEISAYRKMLEEEEERLKLSPSLSSHSIATPATSQGQQLPHGKKRKIKTRKISHNTEFKTVQHASTSGNVSIEEIDADGKFVRLRNNSDEDQLLHGWVLRRHLGSVSDATYKFPSLFTLQAGQVVTASPYSCALIKVVQRLRAVVHYSSTILSSQFMIWGAAAGISPGPSDLVWKSQKSWGTGDSIGVTLITDAGEELAERKIMLIPSGEESGEQDDDYEVTGSELEFPPQTKRRRKKKCCLVS